MITDNFLVIYKMIIYGIQGALLYWLVSFYFPGRVKNNVVSVFLAVAVLLVYRFFSIIVIIPENYDYIHLIVRTMIHFIIVYSFFNINLDKKSFRVSIGLYVFYTITTFISVVIILLISIYKGEISKANPYPYANNIQSMYDGMALVVLWMVIAVNLFLMVLYNKKKNITQGSMILLILMEVVQLGFLIINAIHNRFQTVSEGIFSCALALWGAFTCILVNGFLQQIEQKARDEKQLREIEQRRQQELMYYRTQKKYLEQMHKVKHDFANQLQVIYGLMEDGNQQEKVIEMLNQCEEKLKKV